MTTVEVEVELEIGRNTGGGYPVVARAGGEVATRHLPVASTAEIDRRLAEIGSAVLASSQVSPAIEEERQVREAGRLLFKALVDGEVRDLYVASRQRAQEQGGLIRLVLRACPVELARLPWEFLFDPERQDYLGVRLSLVHYPVLLAPRRPLPVAAPLRILGLVLRPDGQEGVSGEQERRLGTALAGWERDGLVELGWVAGQSTDDLRDALARGPWHALHVVGPGRCDQLGSEEVSRLLADHDTLRLVVLTGGGTGSEGVRDGFAGIAGALLRRGIPAVVAMRFGVTEAAGATVAHTLYHSVARCLPVDVGVLHARQALRLAKKDSLEWGSPVLYLRAPGGSVFTAAPATDDPDADGADSPEIRYHQALDAFWAQRWDQAVQLLREVFAHRPDHPDAAEKLAEACHEQHLATRYTQACAAVDAADWEQAIAGLAMVAEAEPTNLEVRDRLEDAHRQHAAALLARDGEESPDPAPEMPPLVRHPTAEHILYLRKDVNAVAFSPDGRRLATAGNRNIAQIWDTTTGRELLSVGSKAWRRSMAGVAFSPDGDWLATASDDGTARIWDTANGEELLKVTHEGPVWGVAFSADGSWLATVGDDCAARVWEAASGEELAKVTHDNWVRGVAFSPDGRWLATAGVDQTARIWGATSGEEIARVTHESLVSGIAFSPDGRYLATASADQTARIWTLEPDRPEAPEEPAPPQPEDGEQ